MKKQLLALNTSLQEGYSVDMVSHFINNWRYQRDDVVERSLATFTVPHLNP